MFFSSGTAHANESTSASDCYSEYDIRSKVDNHGTPIADIIQEAISAEPDYIDQFAEILFGKELDLDSYCWDTSLYISQYFINTDLLKEIADGNAMDSILSTQHPHIFVPVLGTTDASESVVGYILFSYAFDDTAPYDQLVVLQGAWANGLSDSVFDKLDFFNNYEQIKLYFTDCEIQGMTLIQFDYSYSWLKDCVLLVQTNMGIKILDYDNVAHNPDNNGTCVYSIDEFISYRVAYEEQRNQPTDELIFGGDALSGNRDKVEIRPQKIVLFISVAVIICSAVVCIIIQRRKKHKSTNKSFS